MAKKKTSPKKKSNTVKTPITRLRATLRSRSKFTSGFVFVALFAIVGTILYFISAAAPATPGFKDGQTMAAGNWCMHDNDTTGAAPDPVNVARCDGLATQSWVFTGGTIRDTDMEGTHCLQPAGANTSINTTIVAAQCDGNPSQQWQHDGSTDRFINPTATAANKTNYPNGVCLALPDNNIHYLLGLRPCSDQYPDQNWTAISTVSTYQNPMRDAHFTRGRIDQGVDYHGSGPVKFLGRAVIVQEVSPAQAGWDGGWFTVYRLLDGDDAGKYVYVAEDCTPAHKVSKAIYGSDDTVCNMFNGSLGIETGWAEQPPDHDYAKAHADYHEGLATNFGRNYSNLLGTLGSPNATGNIAKSFCGQPRITPILLANLVKSTFIRGEALR